MSRRAGSGGPGRRSRPSTYTTFGSGPRELTFSDQEIKDLLIAWAALGVAFALFLGGGAGAITSGRFGTLLIVSIVTAGVGFLLHELAHKVVAVKFGQIAEFRADYPMLGLAILSGMAGFIFAAPGAVYHRGRITKEQHGLIAVAGPVTNLALVVAFVPLILIPVGVIQLIGVYGVIINAFLAAFNMIPFGPLDGKTVIEWNKGVFATVFLVSVGLTVLSFVIFLL